MNRKDIIELFHSEETLTVIRKRVGVRYNTIADVWKEEFGEQAFKDRKRIRYRESKLGTNNPMKGKVGKDTYLYKGDDWKTDRKGYIRVRAPAWYEGKQWGSYADEHVIVYCQSRELTKLPEGFVVHHLDFDKKNNSPKNLIMLSNADHSLLHRWLERSSSAETIP